MKRSTVTVALSVVAAIACSIAIAAILRDHTPSYLSQGLAWWTLMLILYPVIKQSQRRQSLMTTGERRRITFAGWALLNLPLAVLVGALS